MFGTFPGGTFLESALYNAVFPYSIASDQKTCDLVSTSSKHLFIAERVIEVAAVALLAIVAWNLKALFHPPRSFLFRVGVLLLSQAGLYEIGRMHPLLSRASRILREIEKRREISRENLRELRGICLSCPSLALHRLHIVRINTEWATETIPDRL
jgi:hypothetical protein